MLGSLVMDHRLSRWWHPYDTHIHCRALRRAVLMETGPIRRPKSNRPLRSSACRARREHFPILSALARDWAERLSAMQSTPSVVGRAVPLADPVIIAVPQTLLIFIRLRTRHARLLVHAHWGEVSSKIVTGPFSTQFIRKKGRPVASPGFVTRREKLEIWSYETHGGLQCRTQ